MPRLQFQEGGLRSKSFPQAGTCFVLFCFSMLPEIREPGLVGMLMWSDSHSYWAYAEFRDLGYIQPTLPFGLEPQVWAHASAVSHLPALTGPPSDYGVNSDLQHPQVVSNGRRRLLFCESLLAST